MMEGWSTSGSRKHQEMTALDDNQYDEDDACDYYDYFEESTNQFVFRPMSLKKKKTRRAVKKVKKKKAKKKKMMDDSHYTRNGESNMQPEFLEQDEMNCLQDIEDKMNQSGRVNDEKRDLLCNGRPSSPDRQALDNLPSYKSSYECSKTVSDVDLVY